MRRDIETLFSAGSRSLSLFPLRVTYRCVEPAPEQPAVKVLLSVNWDCLQVQTVLKAVSLETVNALVTWIS